MNLEQKTSLPPESFHSTIMGSWVSNKNQAQGKKIIELPVLGQGSPMIGLHYCTTGIQVAVSVSGVNPGAHGIHIHEKGDCSANDASSAGEHLNPSRHEHGPPQPKLFHAGDLGNIIINDKGFGVLNLAIPAENLDPNFSWATIIGKSIVLHDEPDDMHSQPSGKSGARISCGFIAKQN